MQKIKTYKEYKKYAIKRLIEKGKEFSFEKVDDRYYYIYRITELNTGMHYYGSRISSIEPELDLGIKYFSSSSNKEFIYNQFTNPNNYKYQIVKIFNNKWDLTIYESYLHQYFNVKLHSKFYNKQNQLPWGFISAGLNIIMLDLDGNLVNKFTSGTECLFYLYKYYNLKGGSALYALKSKSHIAYNKWQFYLEEEYINLKNNRFNFIKPYNRIIFLDLLFNIKYKFYTITEAKKILKDDKLYLNTYNKKYNCFIFKYDDYINNKNELYLKIENKNLIPNKDEYLGYNVFTGDIKIIFYSAKEVPTYIKNNLIKDKIHSTITDKDDYIWFKNLNNILTFKDKFISIIEQINLMNQNNIKKSNIIEININGEVINSFNSLNEIKLLGIYISNKDLSNHIRLNSNRLFFEYDYFILNKDKILQDINDKFYIDNNKLKSRLLANHKHKISTSLKKSKRSKIHCERIGESVKGKTSVFLYYLNNVKCIRVDKNIAFENPLLVGPRISKLIKLHNKILNKTYIFPSKYIDNISYKLFNKRIPFTNWIKKGIPIQGISKEEKKFNLLFKEQFELSTINIKDIDKRWVITNKEFIYNPFSFNIEV